MECPTGYLSAGEFPLLPFYGVMCLIYLTYGIAWLVVSACQWRELIRIQFWIGGVILLGMLEKAVFYAEYQSINSTGTSVVQGAVICAEIISCFKRTLARMLVIIVSLGFGIVKPRLGPMLHRVLGVGALYFILGAFEACSRVLKDWKELWVDEAYWHLLFSVILIVIMVLWRPNNNNQRYAFTPLLDMADEEDEVDITVGNDAFAGMTMRGTKNANNSTVKQKDDKMNDDLKWVEENIPSSLADT
ncbi:Transmembrane protein 87B [Nymphon striatum]|nr:Transmembrane protein 87B [Nymphon striatum]